jgi:hypothetical protein
MAKVVMIKGTIYSGNADGTKMTKAVAGLTFYVVFKAPRHYPVLKKTMGLIE